MSKGAKERVLCVDDEPNVLEGLSLHLSRRYQVSCAQSGAAAVEVLRTGPPVAVVVSDMRMPGMDGATFLALARELAGDAVRILLTGQADIRSAAAAVNDGQIFRFLAKPCSPPMLLQAVEAAVTQHQMLTVEREVLEQTVHGSIKALSDVLAIASPLSFGRAMRIKQHVTDLCAVLNIRERWQVEVAAMLSQLGYITLPTETVERVYYGQPLSDAEKAMLLRVPKVTEQLIANIPRLEPIREVLALAARPFRVRELPEGADRQRARWAQMLQIASDFDALESQGNPTSLVVDTLRGRGERYDPELMSALAGLHEQGEAHSEVREIPLTALRMGMKLAEDFKMNSGTLLVKRGYEVTSGFIGHVRNFRPGTAPDRVRIVMPPDTSQPCVTAVAVASAAA
jgi:response regulator RpfG family c-di-GMP phosphodiesterase